MFFLSFGFRSSSKADRVEFILIKKEKLAPIRLAKPNEMQRGKL